MRHECKLSYSRSDKQRITNPLLGVCVRDEGAERASGACEHALPAHARANWVNRVNPVVPHPGSNGKRIVLEQEVIGPLITFSPLQRRAAPRWIRASGRRTGANAKTLCAAATYGD